MSEEKSLNDVKYLLELWATVLPHIKRPEPLQFVSWQGRFGRNIVERGILRTARKYPTGCNPDDAGRYATGVMLNEEKGRHPQPETARYATLEKTR